MAFVSPIGTTIPFNPPLGKEPEEDNMVVRYQCITAMPEYDYKSLEELRWDDYNEDSLYLRYHLRQQVSPIPGEIIYGDQKAVAELLAKMPNEGITANTGVILDSDQLILKRVHGQHYAPNSHYTVIETLGTGYFGTVCKCKDNESNTYFAIKEVLSARMHNQKSKDYRSLEREVKALLHLKHDNVTKLLGLIKREGTVHIFLECWGMSLKAYLTRVMPTEGDMSVWFLQLLNAVQYIHSKTFVHCDIHLGNVLLCGNHIKLCDFGSVKKIGEPLITYSHGNTPAYFPPTVLRYLQNKQPVLASPRLDTFSIGKNLLEVKIGRSNSFIKVEEMQPYISEKSQWDLFLTRLIPENTGLKIQTLIKGLMSFTTKDGMTTNEAIESVVKYEK